MYQAKRKRFCGSGLWPHLVGAAAVMGLLLVAGAVRAKPSPLRPAVLRCEDLIAPLAIDEAHPRLRWISTSTTPGLRGLRQTAYRILVASSPALLAADRGDLWDSGRVASARSLQVEYAGKPLSSRQRCWWKVRVWDQDGVASPWSVPERWEMGLLAPQDWRAAWIARSDDRNGPLPIFRREFALPASVRSARVYVCGLGHYELRLNGRKVGDRLLDTGWTNYRKRCLYAAYDVTNLLRRGPNAFGVFLGNGMYNVVGGRYVKFTGSFGLPKLILSLRAELADGSTIAIGTDGAWHAAPGPVVFSCAYGGEDHDARREPAGWDRPGFRENAGWRPAAIVPGPGGALRAQPMPPILARQTLRPVAVTEPRPGVRVYDFGVNVSAMPSLTVRGAAGTSVRITPAERLQDGLADQRDSGGPSYYTYTLRGTGDERWSPRFTYYGCRYLQVETTPLLDAPANGAAAAPDIVSLESQVVYPGVETIGTFACSNTLYNQIHTIIRRAIISNMKSVLTDCPHREKLGWLEQDYLVGPGILYNYHVPALYAKIMDDMAEAQLPNGLVPDIAPEYTVFDGGFRDSPEWGSAYVVAPWQVYGMYADLRLLRRHYDGMKRYVDYLLSKARDGIVSHGLGDWADVGPNPPSPHNTPVAVTATAITCHDLAVLREVARRLGREDDVRRYDRLFAGERATFNRAFFQQKQAQYASGSQVANAMALVFGLVEPRFREAVLANLVRDIRAHGDHTTAGDVGHRYVLLALLEGGRSDVIAAMANREDHPSYGYQLAHGATSLTEAWDGPTRGWSQNHFMMGHIEEWFYRGMAGIDVDAAARRIVVRPEPVGATWARAACDTAQGRVESHWRIEGQRFTLTVEIPPNARGEVHLPAPATTGLLESGRPIAASRTVRIQGRVRGRVVLEIGSGRYTFTAPYPQGPLPAATR